MSKKKTIAFSGNFISLNDIKLEISEFRKAFNEQEESITLGNLVQSYSTEFDLNFLKINFSDGSTFPRNPNVINTDTNETEPNPRQTNQVEPREYFGLIDFETCLLWISNNKKRKLVIDLIKRKFENSHVIVKDVFDQEEFIKSIKRLDDIRLTYTPELFRSNNNLTKALSDEINQYEAVEAILHLKYQDQFVGNNLIERISSIFKNKENFKGIMIAGRDESNLGILFNTNEFSRKIELKASVDENEMFTSNEVFKLLMKKINDDKN